MVTENKKVFIISMHLHNSVCTNNEDGNEWIFHALWAHKVIDILIMIDIHPTTKKTSSFRNGSLLFNLQYLGQIFIKSSKQGQFRNQLVLRIPKLPLVVRFDKDLAEILEVEEKASISE